MEARPEDCLAAEAEAGGRLTWGGPEGSFGTPPGPEQGCLSGRSLQLSASG